MDIIIDEKLEDLNVLVDSEELEVKEILLDEKDVKNDE